MVELPHVTVTDSPALIVIVDNPSHVLISAGVLPPLSAVIITPAGFADYCIESI